MPLVDTAPSLPHVARAPGSLAARAIHAVPARWARWTGRGLSAVAVLFLLLDAAMKLFRVPAAVEATARLGYPASVLRGLGVLELACLAVYLLPPTSALGAVLWTGYLGGAVASHLRAGDPLASHVLFPVYVAALLWGGLWLRAPRLRAALPLRPGRPDAP